jgi:DNA-binding XRE family transcriptional regulator
MPPFQGESQIVPEAPELKLRCVCRGLVDTTGWINSALWWHFENIVQQLIFRRFSSQYLSIATILAVVEGLAPWGDGAMNGFSLETPENVSRTLATRVKELRLARGWKQATLAQRSGVSLASLRRFEESGRVSLQNLLDLAFALNRLDDFDTLF